MDIFLYWDEATQDILDLVKKILAVPIGGNARSNIPAGFGLGSGEVQPADNLPRTPSDNPKASSSDSSSASVKSLLAKAKTYPVGFPSVSDNGIPLIVMSHPNVFSEQAFNPKPTIEVQKGDTSVTGIESTSVQSNIRSQINPQQFSGINPAPVPIDTSNIEYDRIAFPASAYNGI